MKVVTKEQSKEVSFVEIHVGFRYEHEYDIDKVELTHALYNMITEFARAGEMNLVKGLEGVELHLEVTNQKTLDRIEKACENCCSCSRYLSEACLTCH